jgi:hypothetical protein
MKIDLSVAQIGDVYLDDRKERLTLSHVIEVAPYPYRFITLDGAIRSYMRDGRYLRGATTTEDLVRKLPLARPVKFKHKHMWTPICSALFAGVRKRVDWCATCGALLLKPISKGKNTYLKVKRPK